MKSVPTKSIKARRARKGRWDKKIKRSQSLRSSADSLGGHSRKEGKRRNPWWISSFSDAADGAVQQNFAALFSCFTVPQGLLLCLPALLGLGGCYLVPFGMAFLGSLREGLTGRFCGLGNYLALWGNSAFRLAAKNTLLFWCAALPLNLALGLGLALLCGRVRVLGHKGGARGALFLPAMIPASCVAILFEALWRLLPGAGSAGLAGQGGAAAILVLYLWKNVGYTVLLYSMALQSIPKTLLDAARQDGAGEAQLLWYIQLPLTLPVSGVCLIVALLGSFRIFRESYLLAGPHPDTALYGLQHFLYNNFANMNYPRLAAASVLLTGLLLAASWLALRRLAKRGRLPDETQD